MILLILLATHGPLSYGEAFQQANRDAKPLVVIVVGDECKYCKELETTIEGMNLGDVSLAFVHKDKEPHLWPYFVKGCASDSQAATRANKEAIPQIHIFGKKRNGKWGALRLIGAHKPETIRRDIDRIKAAR